MVRRAVANGFGGVVLADSLFGTVAAFREHPARDGRPDCVGIDPTPEVAAADADLGPVPPQSGRGRPPTRPSGVRAGATSPPAKGWAIDRARDFRSVTWRDGAKGRMAGRFAVWRVRPAPKLSAGQGPLAARWLVVEWPADAAQPARYFFSNLPAQTRSRRLVAAAKSRRWVEHSDRERKGELGLDHFGGRSWRGWNPHVVLVLMADAFLQDVRRRRPKKVAAA